VKIVCSIGTTEPYHAVGLGLDARVLPELGVRPVSVVAGVSAQDARGLHAAVPIVPELIEAQFRSLEAVDIAAYRIGALLEASSADAIVRGMAQCPRPSVYDPVAMASLGGSFVDSAVLRRIAGILLPAVTIITPNLTEAGMLVGRQVRTMEEMLEAARIIARLGAVDGHEPGVLLKGGHLAGEPKDVLFTGGQVHVFSGERLPGDIRGTGCLLASALAAALAQGSPLVDAVRRSRAFVR
jgi:hydroxymethylpyrimidine/phosphomethylpyrimidine kinase